MIRGELRFEWCKKMGYIDKVYEKVLEKNPHQPEFHQAVKEVIYSLEPCLAKHPIYEENAILCTVVGTQEESENVHTSRKISPNLTIDCLH